MAVTFILRYIAKLCTFVANHVTMVELRTIGLLSGRKMLPTESTFWQQNLW